MHQSNHYLAIKGIGNARSLDYQDMFQHKEHAMYNIHPVHLVNVIRDNFDLPSDIEVSVYNDLYNAFHNPKFRKMAKEMTLSDFAIKATSMNSRFGFKECEVLYCLINR